jgi:hypothetical protein
LQAGVLVEEDRKTNTLGHEFRAASIGGNYMGKLGKLNEF